MHVYIEYVNVFPYISICLEDSRSGKLTLGAKFCLESKFDVDNTKCLHLDSKQDKTWIYPMNPLNKK